MSDWSLDRSRSTSMRCVGRQERAVNHVAVRCGRRRDVRPDQINGGPPALAMHRFVRGLPQFRARSVPRHFRTSTPRARRRCCGWESMLHKWWRSYRILGVRDLAAQRHVCHRAACSLPVTLFHKLPQNWKIVGVDARPSGHRERRQAAHRIAESIGCGPSSTLQSRHQRQARRRSSVLRSCLMLKPCSSRPL